MQEMCNIYYNYIHFAIFILIFVDISKKKKNKQIKAYPRNLLKIEINKEINEKYGKRKNI